jgi:hypothetical protein
MEGDDFQAPILGRAISQVNRVFLCLYEGAAGEAADDCKGALLASVLEVLKDATPPLVM